MASTEHVCRSANGELRKSPCKTKPTMCLRPSAVILPVTNRSALSKLVNGDFWFALHKNLRLGAYVDRARQTADLTLLIFSARYGRSRRLETNLQSPRRPERDQDRPRL